MTESLLTMMEYQRAKERKDILLPLFSRKAILDLQYLIQETVSPTARLMIHTCAKKMSRRTRCV